MGIGIQSHLCPGILQALASLIVSDTDKIGILQHERTRPALVQRLPNSYVGGVDFAKRELRTRDEERDRAEPS